MHESSAKSAFLYVREYPEIAIVASFVLATGAISLFYGVPIVTPQPQAASFIGFGFAWPLFGALLIAAIAYLRFRGSGSRHRMARELFWVLVAIPCYFVTLWLHFNMKLWIQFVNPTLWDASYREIDQALAWLVTIMVGVRQAIAAAAGFNIDHLYLNCFLAMFYASFLLHLLKGDGSLKQVFVGTLLLHSLGSVMYLIAPALGPFIYEPGVNAIATTIQKHFLTVFESARLGGAAWLSEGGSANLLAGLAAMPSLHAGGSWLFVHYAIRHLPWLLIVYVPLFLFIMVEAVATNWHYLIDLPVGVGLASFCVHISGKLRPVRSSAGTLAEVDPLRVERAPAR